MSRCPLPPPPALRTHEPTPFSLQFFLFILLIFLAELSAAILAFIFRENVRTGSHAPWPLQSLAAMAKLPSSPRISLSFSTSSPNYDPPSQGGPVAQRNPRELLLARALPEGQSRGARKGLCFSKASDAIPHLILDSTMPHLSSHGPAKVTSQSEDSQGGCVSPPPSFLRSGM